MILFLAVFAEESFLPEELAVKADAPPQPQLPAAPQQLPSFHSIRQLMLHNIKQLLLHNIKQLLLHSI